MQLPTYHTTSAQSTSRVILIGAGPGDPDLITYKAVTYLQRADVILVDRLVSPEIIARFANPLAKIVFVGKHGNLGRHTTPQSKINELIVQYAKEKNLVVRLKGGDATLFSNILDELEALTEHNIPYEIVPGVSAAFGAAAYTGMPLTARGHARGVRLLTLCQQDGITDEKWADWAKTDDTLVFYMSGLRTRFLLENMLRFDPSFSKSIALVEQATTVEQKTTLFTSAQYDDLKNFTFRDVPTIIIVGSVTELGEKFAWKDEKTYDHQNYFEHTKSSIPYAI